MGDAGAPPPPAGRPGAEQRRAVANLLVIGWAVAFMLWQGAGFAIAIGTVFVIWAILSVSLNLVLGYAGLLSVGHIGFFGIGAYTMAILTSNPAYEQLRSETIPTFAWPFFAALPLCALLAGVVAIIVGVVFNRFRDDMFVLVSFGFTIIAFNVFLNWRAVTRGAFGIHEVAKPPLAGGYLTAKWSFCCWRWFSWAWRRWFLVYRYFILWPGAGRHPGGRAGH